MGNRAGAWSLSKICLRRSAPTVRPVRDAQIARLQAVVTAAARIRGGLGSWLQ